MCGYIEQALKAFAQSQTPDKHEKFQQATKTEKRQHMMHFIFDFFLQTKS